MFILSQKPKCLAVIPLVDLMDMQIASVDVHGEELVSWVSWFLWRMHSWNGISFQFDCSMTTGTGVRRIIVL